ncbi:type I-U CRISPR-associated protein Csb2 [Streptosporangium sp. 'caverna']|uniref:type I-G CRISPR-associated protein Csb2 n=1 Tax=Streptosporangium sp. 'caverna' TaxID=2202249 RepID=UPI000D7E2585|nr:type I-U CRISPR-associated protein Csb2 [Streptosporangium sp. 'caverna']AWS44516.1 type I-U CRISPR-associated protein Cas5/Cas6 [Streptosporangium sp. 'caverna']
MAVVLALHFPWGRYHATPWGRYVNEGAVELPPSPWRLLRALYAIWQLRAPELDAGVVHDLLARLAVPPSYLIPPYRIAHTRHYYPDSKHRSGSISTDKAIDAFAVLDGNQTIYALWPVDLNTEQSDALARLAKSIPYIGRADSTCEAELLDGVPQDAAGHQRVEPIGFDDEDALSASHERADLLCPELPLNLDAVVLRPVDVRAKKLLYPPGTRKITYAVPVSTRPARPLRRTNKKTTVVRLAISGIVQPPLAQTVPLMDALRGACIKIIAAQGVVADSLLAGRTAAGMPLTDGHRHAHFLPYDANGDGRIDEVIVWTPAGLSAHEVKALDSLTRRSIGVPDGVSGPANLNMLLTASGDETLLPPEWHNAARRWKTITPFVPSRHHKPRQPAAEYLHGEVARELKYRGHDAPDVKVEEKANPDFVGFIRRRWRDRKPAAMRSSHCLELHFVEPVQGPITLGHLSHFGLGLFTPVP